MNGYWIRVDEFRPETTFYYFKKKFTAGQKNELVIDACADTRYQLYLNGALCCEGPCQGSYYQRYYDTVDCGDKLVPGENELVMKVMHVNAERFISTYKKDRAAAWLQAKLTVDGEDRSFYTDGTWECLRDDGVSFQHCAGLHGSIPEFEIHHATQKLTPVSCHTWYEVDLPSKSFNTCGCSEPYIIAPRPIPQMQTYPEKPFIHDGKNELDAGKYTTAKVKFTIKAPAGTKVKIIYAECRLTKNGDGSWYKNMRDEKGGLIAGNAADFVECSGEPQTIEPFWYRAFRYVRFEADNGADIEILCAGYREYFYPMHDIAKFECSDPELNKMWDVSINTVRCCMHEIYVDCPYYEQQQYDMDSANEALFTYRFISDTRMQKKCITDLAHSQIPDGMIQANYPSTMVQVIPDFSLFFIFMIRDYMHYTGDMKFVRSLTGNIDRVLESFKSFEDERGLFGTTPYWAYVDWVPGWFVGIPDGGREEPLTISNLMYSAALNAAAEIAEATGKPGAASDYRARAEQINALVRKYCYDEEKGMYRNTPSRSDFSEHTTLWAVLADAVKGDEARALMERTLEADVPRCTFSMNYYMFRALEKSGCYDRADKVLDGWRHMLDMHCTTWCENPGQPRSECHGWSSAPAYEFSAMILGVKPASPGFDTVTVTPFTETLDWAKGEVPTPHGKIYVEWHKKDGKFTLNVRLPEGVKLVE